MFTGLIETIGTITKCERRGDAARLTVTAELPADDVKQGDSIAINGACLTVVTMGGGAFIFDVSPETMLHTTFKRLAPGSPVNVERALRLSDRLGGHLVTGHVDCLATILERRELTGNVLFSFRLPPDQLRYLVVKGSVTIEGVSLTVNAVTSDSFSVNIIPLTTSCTTLKYRRPGDEVNIETDILGKYVERLLKQHQGKEPGGLSQEILALNGFM